MSARIRTINWLDVMIKSLVTLSVSICISQTALAETTIRVGQHRLRPNAPSQQIDVLVDGDELISGIDLYAQIGDGGPGLANFSLPSGTPGPAITAVDFSDATIFAEVDDVASNLSSPMLPQAAVYSLALLGTTRRVRADGVLLTMTIDTTGFVEGDWTLNLSNVLPFDEFGGPYDTSFAESGVPTIENGSLAIDLGFCDRNGDMRCDRLGDFDADDVLGPLDIDSLSRAVRSGSTSAFFDIDFDGQVSESDRGFWVHEILNTFFGDANLDGEFNSNDFVDVFQFGIYEDDISNNAGWDSGDWDGDGEFSSSDFVFAFTDGGYEQGPRPQTPVPEPRFPALLIVVAVVYCRRRRPEQRRSHRRTVSHSSNVFSFVERFPYCDRDASQKNATDVPAIRAETA